MVVRYLSGEPPEMAERAAEIIDHEAELQVTDVVLAETAYVLSSVYKVPRHVIVDLLMALLRKDSVVCYGLDSALVLQALLMCRTSGRISIADALIWAAARSAGATTVYSLDERFPKDDLEVLQEAQ